MGNRDPVDIILSLAGIAERFSHYISDIAQMLAAGKFRHHSSEASMGFHLRGHNIRQNIVAIFHQSGSRFIAGGFDSQNKHI
jgi:hypothetical protein